MFLSRNTTRQADAGGDRSPWGNFWFEPIGMRSSTGLRVTPISAMRLSAVYSCVRVLSETFAVLPFKLYKRRTDGGRDEVRDHWLYRLLAKAPNAWQTPFEWREMMMGHLCLRGNAFNQIEVNGRGDITSLVPIHPDRIQCQLLVNGDFNYLVKQLDGSTATLSRGQVWHIRGLSSDGYVGMSPIEVASEVFGLGLAAQSYGARFFANDAKPGGWLEVAGKFADDDAKKKFSDSWQRGQTGSNRGKTAILESGMKYHELTLNNNDAQFLETRKYSRSEIASIFRVPPHKIGDLEKATFSNIEQQSLEFVNDTMTPWAERWESSIETFLLLDGMEGDDLEVEFDFANLLRGDSAARGTYYTGGINGGWLTRNEARISEGLNPIDGLNEPLRPLNMVENSQASTPDVIPATPNDNSADVRTVALLQGNADRMARRIAAGSPPSAEVLASALLIDLTAAAACLNDLAGQQQPAYLVAAELMLVASRSAANVGQAHPVADAQAIALMRLATAISQQPSPAAPVINVTVPERSVTVAGPQIDVHVPAARPMQSVAVRNADGVIERMVQQPID